MPAASQVLDPLTINHLHADLKSRSVRGGALALASQGIQFISQSVSTVVLARLLTPADFGLVAMVTAITAMGQSFADLGLSEATIQRTDITRSQVSNLFWINTAVGALLMSITAALAPALAWFYREPRLTAITLFTSLTFLIGGLRVQHTALLKRQMRYSALAVRDITSSVLAVCVALAMALHGAGYWSLVALPLVLNATQMILSWVIVRWLPKLPARGAGIRSLVSFGGHVAASYIVTNFNQNADNILIGWYWGAGPLGLYSRAYNLLMLPVKQLIGPAHSVAVPALSRLQDDPERFARYYLRMIGAIMWVSMPIFGFLFVAANPVIVLALGKQWRAAAPVFQILAISAIGQLLLESCICLLVSGGQSKRLFKLLAALSPAIIGSFLIGLPFGIKGVALAGSLALALLQPLILKFVFRNSNLTLRRLWESIRSPVLTCLLAVSGTQLILRFVHPGGPFVQVVAAAAIFGSIYLLLMIVPAIRRDVTSLARLLIDLQRSRA